MCTDKCKTTELFEILGDLKHCINECTETNWLLTGSECVSICPSTMYIKRDPLDI